MRATAEAQRRLRQTLVARRRAALPVSRTVAKSLALQRASNLHGTGRADMYYLCSKAWVKR